MKKKMIWIGLLFILMVSIVYSVSTYEYNDPLTKSIGDKRYCVINGECNLTTLNAINVNSQNVTGDIDLNGYDITSVDEVNANTLYGNLSWGYLYAVPAGFADGVDNDTQYFYLSEFTDDINASYWIEYTHLSNFTNDEGFITDGNDGWDNIYFLAYLDNITWENLQNIPEGFADNVDNDTKTFGSGYYLINSQTGNLIYVSLNETTLNNTITTLIGVTSINASNIEDIWVNETGDTMTGNLNMSGNNITDIQYLWFASNESFIRSYYNGSKYTIELWVNGELQQDWGASTTIYQTATFLDNAFFKDLFFEGAGGEGLFINTSIIVGENLTVQGLIHGNGTYITDVCHSDGTGCDFNATQVFNLSNSWNDLLDIPNGFADNIDNDSQLYTSAPELYITGKELFFNQTYNNLTIGSLAEVSEYEDTFTISVSGGVGSSLSNLAIDFSITRIKVIPPTNSTAYRFLAIEENGGEVIDQDRIPHKGVWDIRKSHAINNDYVNASISGAVTDGTYTIKVTYLDNYT